MVVTANHACLQGCRESLEDCVRTVGFQSFKQPSRILSLLVVLDGVGGNNGGEVASKTAADEIVAWCARQFADPSLSKLDRRSVEDLARRAIVQAHQAILRAAKARADLADMATTVALILVDSQGFTLVWVGDSRVYLFQQNRLNRLTRDHSVRQELIESGVDEADALLHPDAHTITQCLGGRATPVPGMASGTLAPGDLLLLCTDGLTDVLRDNDIAQAILAHQSARKELSQLPERLANQALRLGSSDNVTVLVAEVQPDFALVTARTRTEGYHQERLARNRRNRQEKHHECRTRSQ